MQYISPIPFLIQYNVDLNDLSATTMANEQSRILQELQEHTLPAIDFQGIRLAPDDVRRVLTNICADPHLEFHRFIYLKTEYYDMLQGMLPVDLTKGLLQVYPNEEQKLAFRAFVMPYFAALLEEDLKIGLEIKQYDEILTSFESTYQFDLEERERLQKPVIQRIESYTRQMNSGKNLSRFNAEDYQFLLEPSLIDLLSLFKGSLFRTQVEYVIAASNFLLHFQEKKPAFCQQAMRVLSVIKPTLTEAKEQVESGSDWMNESKNKPHQSTRPSKKNTSGYTTLGLLGMFLLLAVKIGLFATKCNRSNYSNIDYDFGPTWRNMQAGSRIEKGFHDSLYQQVLRDLNNELPENIEATIFKDTLAIFHPLHSDASSCYSCPMMHFVNNSSKEVIIIHGLNHQFGVGTNNPFQQHFELDIEVEYIAPFDSTTFKVSRLSQMIFYPGNRFNDSLRTRVPFTQHQTRQMCGRFLDIDSNTTKLLANRYMINRIGRTQLDQPENWVRVHLNQNKEGALELDVPPAMIKMKRLRP